jgi:exodeoxyribonuclease VII large subunit
MEEAGEGALRRAFEELKARLAAEGLFESARKRPLPRFARRLGLITSARGAAVRDVLTVLSRRWPLLAVEVLPVPVQGAGAAQEIRAMLERAGACGRYDVLLLTRGGGSLEDLWSFNDEALARAIVASPVPVVSAVGHEIDFSLADFAADLRAATPSAAAELLVPERGELLAAVRQLHARLDRAMQRRLAMLAQRGDVAGLRLQGLRPQLRLERGGNRLALLGQRLDNRAAPPPGTAHAATAGPGPRAGIGQPVGDAVARATRCCAMPAAARCCAAPPMRTRASASMRSWPKAAAPARGGRHARLTPLPGSRVHSATPNGAPPCA